MGMGTVNVPGLIGRGGIPEAPTDGEKYLRQNGAWAALTETGDLASLTTDAKTNLVAAINEIVSFSKALKESSGSGRFNSIYRGKDLGTTTPEVLLDISSRMADSFSDLYCGDMLTGKTSGTVYCLAHANYFSPIFAAHPHIVVVPRDPMYNTSMNDTNATTGAYVNSKMFTTNLQQAIDTIEADFGADHMLEYSIALHNSTTNPTSPYTGRESAFSSYTRKVDLMDEMMAVGSYVQDAGSSVGGSSSNYSYRYTQSTTQLALYRYQKNLLKWTWLRNVCSAIHFAMVDSSGHIISRQSNQVLGVIPFFLLH